MKNLIVLAVLVLSSSAWAGGSISSDEFLKAISHPTVQKSVIANYNLNSQGLAMRVGRALPHISGSRMLPYEIMASGKAQGEIIVLRISGNFTTNELSIISCEQSAFKICGE